MKLKLCNLSLFRTLPSLRDLHTNKTTHTRTYQCSVYFVLYRYFVIKCVHSIITQQTTLKPFFAPVFLVELCKTASKIKNEGQRGEKRSRSALITELYHLSLTFNDSNRHYGVQQISYKHLMNKCSSNSLYIFFIFLYFL